MSISLTTASATFRYAADQIATGFAPGERAEKTSATFRQLADIAGDLPLSPADLAAGFELLAVAHAADEPKNVTGRRATCAEIAELLRPVSAGDAQRLAAVFRAVVAHFVGSSDPRQAAMAATAAREAGELEALAAPVATGEPLVGTLTYDASSDSWQLTAGAFTATIAGHPPGAAAERGPLVEALAETVAPIARAAGVVDAHIEVIIPSGPDVDLGAAGTATIGAIRIEGGRVTSGVSRPFTP